MEFDMSHEEPVCLIDEEKYVDFYKTLNREFGEINDLMILKDKAAYGTIKKISAYIFKDEIEHIIPLMNDPYIGISALDIPESSSLDKKINSIYGVIVTLGIFGNIGNPNIDFINKMPFSIYSASHENAKLLDSKEFIQYPPEVKLGFHNDGLFHNEEINIPFHIMVYNMYINYRQPGNFKWVPIACWDEADKYADLLKEKLAKIRITPDFYFDKEGKIKNSLIDMVEIPICKMNDHGERMFFLNGNVLVEDNQIEMVELINSLRESIGHNHMKISINQKERRAIYLRNDVGFHARDMFEEPIGETDLTRVFIRAVDLNAKKYSTC